MVEIQTVIKKQTTQIVMTNNLKSKISHNKSNNRIYLIDLHPDDFPVIIDEIQQLADKNDYTKLFVNIPAQYAPAFFEAGYIIEAIIPNFYNACDDAFFMVKYTEPKRAEPNSESLAKFQKLLLDSSEKKCLPTNTDYHIQELNENHINKIITVFNKVFKTYPFPIFDPDFLKKSISNGATRYFGAFYKRQLVAVSAADCRYEQRNVEMTDFAVIPSHRGKGLAMHLLAFMEDKLIADGYKCFYTIARLNSLAMNKTFYNLGYKYCGTLHNNTQISGKIESMNIWYKNN